MQYHPPSHPLSHHEILGLAAPFARRGRHVDLAASQRLERRLAFKEVPGPDGLREGLRLENPASGRYLLTRTLTRPDGLQVELQTSGADPAVLLARLDTVAPESQWHVGPGHVLAIGMRLDPAGSSVAADAPLRLAYARALTQLQRLADFHARHSAEAPAVLKRLQQVAINNGNLFAELMETVKYCSLGQITNALYSVGGQYRRNM